MMGFILKLKKLEVRLIRKTLMQRELQKMLQAMLDQAKFSMIQSQSRMEQDQKDMETLLSTFTENIEDQQSQNVPQNDDVVAKKKKKLKRRKDYSNTKVKTRNLLTNASFRFKQSDFNKNSFIVDILSFLLQKLNPLNLERKLEMEEERDMIKFMWDECIPHEFVRFMYKHKYYNQIS